jgi:phage terminase small subunit
VYDEMDPDYDDFGPPEPSQAPEPEPPPACDLGTPEVLPPLPGRSFEDPAKANRLATRVIHESKAVQDKRKETQAGPNKELTPRERVFVNALLEDPSCSFTKAAIAAGYSPKSASSTGHQLSKRERVQAALAARSQAAAESNGLSVEWVLSELKDNVAKAKTSHVIFDKQGNPVESKPDLTAANKALELIARYLQMFTDKVDVTSGGKKVEVKKQIAVFMGYEIEF